MSSPPGPGTITAMRMFSRRTFLKAAFWGGIGYTTVVEPNWIVLNPVDLAGMGLPSELGGMKIAFLSDLHRGAYSNDRDIEAACELAMDQNPDLIILGGDYVQGGEKYIEPCARVLACLSAPLGVYAVLGNHDYWAGPDKVRGSLENAGIRVLVNDVRQLEYQGFSFALAGLDDALVGNPNPWIVDPKGFTLVALHEPDYTEMLPNAPLLQLSGHSHGGQIRIPFLGHLYAPRMARKYTLGLYRAGKRLLHVSKGVGGIYPIRFYCAPEVCLVTL